MIAAAPNSGPVVSVIVVAYQAREDLARCLAGLYRVPPRDPFEVVVLDNGSTDGTSAMLAEHFPAVRALRSEGNLGLSAGVNRACCAATGELLCLLDADTVVEPGAIDTLTAFLRADAEWCVAAGRMLDQDGTVQETARQFPRALNGLFGRQTLLTRLFPHNPISTAYLERQHLSRQEPFEVEWVAAACMMFPRRLFKKLGGFDEEFFVYWVDADWCWRAREVGAPIYCVPAARVFHIEQNRTGRRKSTPAIRSFHQGAYRFYAKHRVPEWWNPLRWAAWAALSVRCQLIVAANTVRR
ncbi:MAG: glycosyltransferase family 2 protein [Acidobacteria bacterium]|nr:glycosyltransferase family 2 protein [Acidobacteriota bacterium]